jgi:crotonobetaine/carnitine-CoA ligase
MRFMSELPAPQLLARRAEECGDKALFTVVETGEVFTFRALHEAALAWSHGFRRLGVDVGDTVVAMVPTGPDAYLSWLGLGWLRALEVPVNTAYRGSILAYVINNSRARAAVVSSRYLDRLVEVAGELSGLDVIVVPDATGALPTGVPFRVMTRDEFLAGGRLAEEFIGPEMTDAAAVIYTSGTTGPSKGVLVPWAELGSMVSCFPDDGFHSGARLYSFWPTFHVSGKWPLYGAIDRAASLFVRERWQTECFWNDVRTHGITLAPIIGPIPLFLVAQPESPDDADNPLEHVIMAPVIPAYREFEQRFGVKVHTSAGMTETGLPFRGYHPLPNHRTGGRLVAGYEARLVADDGSDVGPNVPGEALIRSPHPGWLSSGYLNMPEATAEAWRDGWFHTGDAYMYDTDGNWYFVDRLKDCLRRRGENISSFELENEVNAHPDVLESAAVAVASDWGEDEVKVAVVRKADRPLSERELVEFLIPRLPHFMVPRYVEFVDELPKTPTGKVRKVELRGRGVTPATWDRQVAGVVVPR